MLVLARKLDESILIGDTIVVKVVAIENGNVKLGIEAPKDVSIMRSELIEEVKAINKASAKEHNKADIDSLSQMFTKR
jgi:carbon storage regulator CsrA